MAKHSKRHRELNAKIDRQAILSLDDAIKTIKELSNVKFDETVDIAVNLGVDPRHADQMVRGTAPLPHGTGKTVRVLVFAKGEKAKEAEEAGADFVGAEDMVEKIQGGWLDFDRTVASPDVMGLVGKIGRVLGPRGLMPNPKLGTVTFDLAKTVKAIKAGQATFRVEKAGIIHAGVGKVSFPADHLAENIRSVIDQLNKMKPAAVKGTYMKRMTLSSTMGPGLKVDLQSL